MYIATWLVSGVILSCSDAPVSEADGVAKEETRSALVERVFNDLGPETMDLLSDFYDQSVVFEDPLGKVEGLAKLRSYYEGMYENVTSIAFDFHEETLQGNTHVVQWTMRVKAKKLKNGEEVALDGVSVIRFGESGKVVYHRDYFDMGAFVYRHVPVLKTFVNAVNKRLKQAH